jgi:hypothetical protein
LRRSNTLETGSLEDNLQHVEFPEDTTDLEASVENGALTVVVPKGVAVSAHAEVGNGTVSFLGSERTGENLDRHTRARATTKPTTGCLWAFRPERG